MNGLSAYFGARRRELWSQIWLSIRVRTLVFSTLFVSAACFTAGDPDSAKGDSVEAIPKATPARSATSDESAAARTFVQEFYAWYAPVANKSHREPAWYAVLDQRSRVLGDTLLRALRRDREEQSKAVGEIAGLDFDPFLAAQDPCTSYVAGDTEVSRGLYHVSVFGVCGGKRHSQPDVVAEVAGRDSSWVFVDFSYPGPNGGNLLAILRSTDSASTK